MFWLSHLVTSYWWIQVIAARCAAAAMRILVPQQCKVMFVHGRTALVVSVCLYNQAQYSLIFCYEKKARFQVLQCSTQLSYLKLVETRTTSHGTIDVCKLTRFTTIFCAAAPFESRRSAVSVWFCSAAQSRGVRSFCKKTLNVIPVCLRLNLGQACVKRPLQRLFKYLKHQERQIDCALIFSSKEFYDGSSASSVKIPSAQINQGECVVDV